MTRFLELEQFNRAQGKEGCFRSRKKGGKAEKDENEDDFKENYNDIYVLFAFFLENGFLQMRQKEYGTVLESLRQSCQENLQRLDKHQFANYLHLFTGRKMMDLNVFILFQAI